MQRMHCLPSKNLDDPDIKRMHDAIRRWHTENDLFSNYDEECCRDYRGRECYVCFHHEYTMKKLTKKANAAANELDALDLRHSIIIALAPKLTLDIAEKIASFARPPFRRYFIV